MLWLLIVCDTDMDGQFHIIDMRCEVKHIGTCYENKFTELDQIIISHIVLSVNDLVYIVINIMFSNDL